MRKILLGLTTLFCIIITNLASANALFINNSPSNLPITVKYTICEGQDNCSAHERTLAPMNSNNNDKDTGFAQETLTGDNTYITILSAVEKDTNGLVKAQSFYRNVSVSANVFIFSDYNTGHIVYQTGET